MLDRLGINVRDQRLRTRNVAAVMVTANLPAYVEPGSRVDVSVNSMGDATSLRGGTLLMTPLSGGDGQIYAVAQGALVVSGFSVTGQAESLVSGVATAARIPNGALVERAVAGTFSELPGMALELKNPDFHTAVLISDAINAYTLQKYGRRAASPRDYRTVVLSRPGHVGRTRFMAEIGELQVQPDIPAKVVIDQRTGTVVIGRNVQVSTVAVSRDDVSRMGAALKDAGIPFDISADGTSVLVSYGQTAQARMLLAEKGLPQSGKAGYELFNDLGSLGLTSFMQDITRVRALEGEIARTIQTLKSVKAARVHIVMPDPGSFRREQQPASASVVVRTEPANDATVAPAIRQLVAAAIPGMKPDKVTVLNTDGTVLLAGDDATTAPAGRLTNLEQSVNREIQDNIRRTLTPYLGPNNFEVSVVARLNTDKTKTDDPRPTGVRWTNRRARPGRIGGPKPAHRPRRRRHRAIPAAPPRRSPRS